VIAGLIIDMRQIQDRRGRDMAFITLEDQSGQLEVIAFADSFARSEFFLFKGTVVVVQGKLQSGEQGTKLIAENIYPLEEAPLKLAKSLHIRVPRRMITDEGLMRELYETIARNSKVEGCLVYLHLPEGEGEEETVARLSMRMRLKPSAELMEQINTLLGDEGKTLVWTEVEE